jgi:hypothetical protein
MLTSVLLSAGFAPPLLLQAVQLLASSLEVMLIDANRSK